MKPPIADCCFPAPLVLELDPDGKGLRTWGGPGDGYTWYDQEHGIYLDHNGFVWTGTSNGHHVMKFTQDGKHVLTIGTPGVNKGSNDPDHLGGPANFYVEPKTNEIFIADATSTSAWSSTTPPPVPPSATGVPTARCRTTPKSINIQSA